LTAESNRERGACFLAERLWLLVPANEIVPTLDVAFARLGELIRDGRPYLTFMTGPSRSADIERTLTVGVHGPRALTVVVVGEPT
jgi:L-lactate dehydrogenase complex protein LldG